MKHTIDATYLVFEEDGRGNTVGFPLASEPSQRASLGRVIGLVYDHAWSAKHIGVWYMPIGEAHTEPSNNNKGTGVATKVIEFAIKSGPVMSIQFCEGWIDEGEHQFHRTTADVWKGKQDKYIASGVRSVAGAQGEYQ